MFLNEFVDLSETQYSLEEDSLEISNAMEPMALDIANVHTRTLGQDYIGEPQIENVYEEGEENEINYDLSIDKNNQKASEQELSLIGKEGGEESKEITATTTSTTSTEQKEIQEDTKEEEQTSEQEKENQTETDYNRTGFTDQTLNLKQRLQREFGGYIDQRKNLDEWLRREFGSQVEDKEQDIQKDEPEQELSAVGNKDSEESNKISADAGFSDSFTAQDNTKEDNKEKEQAPEQEKESEREETSADSEEQDESEIEEEINKDEYRNLMDSELQRYFKEYFEKTRKNANWGLRITSGFKNFLENQKSIPNKVKEELINKISKINKNKEIEDFLYNQIKSTNLSSRKISKIFNKISLDVSFKTIVRIAKKVLTPEEKKKRFPPPPKIPEDVREKIIADIKDLNSGSQGDLAKKHNVSRGHIGRIAKKVLTPEEKKKRFPPSPKINLNKETEEEIKLSLKGKENKEENKKITATTSSTTSTVQKNNQEDDKESELTSERNEESLNNNDIKDSKKGSENLNKETEEEVKLEGEESESLEDLVDKAKEEFKIFKDPKLKELIKKYEGLAYKGTHFTMRFIKFINSEENNALNRREKDNLIKRIDEFNENKNLNNLLKYYIRYTKLSQPEIFKKLKNMNLKASIYTIKKISHEILTQKEYEERFTANKDLISDEQREGIIKAGRSKNPIPVYKIAEKWGVALSSALIIIGNDLGEREFNKKFHTDILQLIGFENHKLIEKIATQDFDEKRKKTPNVPILISEPPIYTNSKKRCDNAFKNDKKYLQKLLKDRIAKELKIDPKKLDHIEVVLFDYTRSLKKRTIMDKIMKYQHLNIMLFIVGTYWFYNWIARVKSLPKDKRIKYPENIRIIRWDLFADLLNLSDDNRKRLKEIIKLSRLKDLETLRRLNEQNNYKLHRLKKSKNKKKGSKNNLDAFLAKI